MLFLDDSLVLSVLRANRCERLTPHLMTGKRSLITRRIAEVTRLLAVAQNGRAMIMISQA